MNADSQKRWIVINLLGAVTLTVDVANLFLIVVVFLYP